MAAASAAADVDDPLPEVLEEKQTVPPVKSPDKPAENAKGITSPVKSPERPAEKSKGIASPSKSRRTEAERVSDWEIIRYAACTTAPKGFTPRVTAVSSDGADDVEYPADSDGKNDNIFRNQQALNALDSMEQEHESNIRPPLEKFDMRSFIGNQESADVQERLTKFDNFHKHFMSSELATEGQFVQDPLMLNMWFKHDPMFQQELDPVVAFLLWRVSHEPHHPKCPFRPLLMPCLTSDEQSHQVKARLCCESWEPLFRFILTNVWDYVEATSRWIVILHHLLVVNRQAETQTSLGRIRYYMRLIELTYCATVTDKDSIPHVRGVEASNDSMVVVNLTDATIESATTDQLSGFHDVFRKAFRNDIVNAYDTAWWKMRPTGTAGVAIANHAAASLLEYHVTQLKLLGQTLYSSDATNQSPYRTYTTMGLVVAVVSLNTLSIRNEVHARLLASDSKLPTAEFESWQRAMQAITTAIGDSVDANSTDVDDQAKFHVACFMNLKTFVHCEWRRTAPGSSTSIHVALDVVGNTELSAIQSDCVLFQFNMEPDGVQRVIALPPNIRRVKGKLRFPKIATTTASLINNMVDAIKARQTRCNELPFYYPRLAVENSWRFMSIFRNNVHRGFLKVANCDLTHLTALSRLYIEQSTAAPDRMLLIQRNDEQIPDYRYIDFMPLAITSHAVIFTTKNTPAEVRDAIVDAQLAVYESSMCSPHKKGLGKRKSGPRGAWAVAKYGDAQRENPANSARSVSDGKSIPVSENVQSSDASSSSTDARRQRRLHSLPREVLIDAFGQLDRELPEYTRVTKPTWTDFRRLVLMGYENPKRTRYSVLLSVRKFIGEVVSSFTESHLNLTGPLSDMRMYTALTKINRKPRFSDFVMHAIDSCAESSLYEAFQNLKSELKQSSRTAEDVAAIFATFLSITSAADDAMVDDPVNLAAYDPRVTHYEQLIQTTLFAILQSLVLTHSVLLTEMTVETSRELEMALRVFVTFVLQKPRHVVRASGRQKAALQEVVFDGKNYGSDMAGAMRDYWRALIVEVTRHYVTSVLRGKFDLTGLPIPLLGTSSLPMVFLLPDLYNLALQRWSSVLDTGSVANGGNKSVQLAQRYFPIQYIMWMSMGFSRLLSPIGAVCSYSAMSRAHKRSNAVVTQGTPGPIVEYFDEVVAELRLVTTSDEKLGFTATMSRDITAMKTRIADHQGVAELTMGAWWTVFAHSSVHDKTLHEYVASIPNMKINSTPKRMAMQRVARLVLKNLLDSQESRIPLLFRFDDDLPPGVLESQASALLASAMRHIPADVVQQLSQAAQVSWETAKTHHASAANDRNDSAKLPAFVETAAIAVALLDASHTKLNRQLESVLGSYVTKQDYINKHEKKDAPLRAAIGLMVEQIALRLMIRVFIANKCPAAGAPAIVMLLSQDLASQMMQLVTYVMPTLGTSDNKTALSNFIESVGFCTLTYDPFAAMAMQFSQTPDSKDAVFNQTRGVLSKALAIAANTMRMNCYSESVFLQTIVSELVPDVSDEDDDEFKDSISAAIQEETTPEAIRSHCCLMANKNDLDKSSETKEHMLVGAQIYNWNRRGARTAESLCVAYDKATVSSWNFLEIELEEFVHTELRVACQLVVRCVAQKLRSTAAVQSFSPLVWLDLASDALILLTQIALAEREYTDEEDKAYAYSKVVKQDLRTLFLAGKTGNETVFPSMYCSYWLNPTNVQQFLARVDAPNGVVGEGNVFQAPVHVQLPLELRQSVGPLLSTVTVLPQTTGLPSASATSNSRGSTSKPPQPSTIVPDVPPSRSKAKEKAVKPVPGASELSQFVPHLTLSNYQVIATINQVKQAHKFKIWFAGMDATKWFDSTMSGGLGEARHFVSYNRGIPRAMLSDTKINNDQWFQAISAMIEIDEELTKETAEKDIEYREALKYVGIPKDWKPPAVPKPRRKSPTSNKSKAAAPSAKRVTKAKAAAAAKPVAEPPRNWLEQTRHIWINLKQTLTKSRGMQTYILILPAAIKSSEKSKSGEDRVSKWGTVAINLPSAIGIKHPAFFQRLAGKDKNVTPPGTALIEIFSSDSKDNDSAAKEFQNAFDAFSQNILPPLMALLMPTGAPGVKPQVTVKNEDSPWLSDALEAFLIGRRRVNQLAKAAEIYDNKDGTPIAPLLQGMNEKQELETPKLRNSALALKADKDTDLTEADRPTIVEEDTDAARAKKAKRQEAKKARKQKKKEMAEAAVKGESKDDITAEDGEDDEGDGSAGVEEVPATAPAAAATAATPSRQPATTSSSASPPPATPQNPTRSILTRAVDLLNYFSPLRVSSTSPTKLKLNDDDDMAEYNEFAKSATDWPFGDATFDALDTSQKVEYAKYRKKKHREELTTTMI